MKEINNDINLGEYKHFYLLYGEEDYLRTQYRDKLGAALGSKEDTMNYNYYEGAKLDVGEVIGFGETLPFFADRRVMIIENSGWMKKSPEDIEKKLEELPDTTYVVFVEAEVDKRSRLFKWVSKNGYASEMKKPSAKMLATWIQKMCQDEEKNIEMPTIEFLIEHMGTDMLLLKQEMEKLFSYTIDKDSISIDDVHEVCVNQATDKLFDMLDAIGNHNQDRALQLYRDLLALREPAMKILYMLARHYRILMEVAALLSEGKDNKTIASACSIAPFLVGRYAKQAQQADYATFNQMLEQCQLTDQKIKTGRIQDVVGVELLIVEFSTL